MASKSNKSCKLSFTQPKEVKKVTRGFLESIANGIYNPKTRKFLNLCPGTLQNGPDPSCATRPMHCGPGELYYVVTGRQPEAADVTESDVINAVVERCDFDRWNDIAEKSINALSIPESMKSDLIDALDANNPEEEFRSLLDDIPNENDGADSFKVRARRVATQIRKAAALLPE